MPHTGRPGFRQNGFKRKGRYVLLALAVAGVWWARQSGGPDAGATVLPPASPAAATPAPDCAPTPEFSAAPEPPAGLSGRLGLWVARLDPATLRPVKAVARDPDGVYPLASSYKQAVLLALLRAVDEGRVSLNETFDVTHANQSLGSYPFDDSTVDTLMHRMIHNSDNTATDILHRRVGLESVQAVADGLKLCHTRLVLPTKTWWVAQAGLDPAWPGAERFARLRGPDRLHAALDLDRAAQQVRAGELQRSLDRYFEDHYDARADLGTQNVSTPAEFGALIAHEFLQSGLSDANDRKFREVMSTGFGRSKLTFPVAYFGGKGGNGWKILTMTGYAETPDGERLVYVFMQHGSDQDYTMHNTSLAFRWINAAAREVLGE